MVLKNASLLMEGIWI